MLYCAICLENFKIYEAIRMLKCGHYYHNYCHLKYNSTRCATCRQLTGEATTVCFSTEMDTNIIDPSPRGYRNLLEFNKNNLMMIEYQKKIDNKKLHYERMEKEQEIFKDLLKENIIEFRFKVLKAVSEGRSSATLFTCGFNEKYSGLSLYYILKGPLNFFRNKNTKTFIDMIKEEFIDSDVFVITDHYTRTNLIRIHF